MEKFDLIVVGSGPGGYIAAERAGELGKKVLLVEKDNLGGVCTNKGCIPTKALLNAAKNYEHALNASKFGVHVEGVSFNLSEAMKWKMDTIEQLRKGIAYLMKTAKVEVVFGEAEFVDNHTIKVGNDTYSTDYMILATGSRSFVPPIPGHDLPHVITSDEILDLEKVPESLVVIGGGVIGIEFASFFSMIGVKVTVIEMMDEILPMLEADFAKQLGKKLEGVTIKTSCKVTAIDEKAVHYTDAKGKDQAVETELVLMSVGRRANSQNMDKLGLDIERGFVKTNDRMQSNIANIYAIGDLNGKSMLAHSASRMAEVAVDNIFGEKRQIMRLNAIPWAVYCNPEVAGCGMTEAQAIKEGYKVVSATTQYRANGRFLAENGKKDNGYCKIIAEADSGKILGIQMVGPYSSEQIWGAAVVIEDELRVQDLKEVIFPHPSVSEVIKDACLAIK